MAKKASITNTPPAPQAEQPQDRIRYEVLGGPLNMGRGDIRSAGATVYEDELGTEMTQYLLGKGEIGDPNAPVAPSRAAAVLAFDHLLDIAKDRRCGAVIVDGGTYQLAGAGDEATHKGLIEFRKNVSIDQLKAAILARFE